MMANEPATKYIIRNTYENGTILFVKEGDFGKLSEVDRLGDAAFYSTAEDALIRAKRYALEIHKHGDGVKTTMVDVMAVKLTETRYGFSV